MARPGKDRAKALYDRRRALGVCVRCGAQSDGASLCKAHQQAHAVVLRDRYALMTRALKSMKRRQQTQPRNERGQWISR